MSKNLKKRLNEKKALHNQRIAILFSLRFENKISAAEFCILKVAAAIESGDLSYEILEKTLISASSQTRKKAKTG